MWTGVCVPDPNAAGSISYFYIIILTVQLQYKAQEIFEYPHIFPHSPRLNSKWDIFSRLVEPEFHEKSSLVWWGTSGPLKLNCNIKGGIELYILGWEEGWEKFLSFFFHQTHIIKHLLKWKKHLPKEINWPLTLHVTRFQDFIYYGYLNARQEMWKT